jgi:peptidoglycan/LPS O-acetylase OafA/YrhL
MKNNTPQQLIHPKYRADIDGLRAIAVLSVVSFHAFPNSLKGGFIGVDIFFVISGFLISTIIFSNLERDRFSFVEFYSRRIKRIFPALLLVLIVCFTAGWFVLLADEYKQLGKHIAGGAGFISNFMFWNESGYFDNAAETKPLLHLWSLGIEEQFYIVWPLLLWFTWKQRLNLLTITVIVLIISFTLNISKVHSDATAAFYSPQTRFWELLIGSVLAYVTLYKQNILPNVKQKIDGWLSSSLIYAQVPDNGIGLRNAQSLLGATLITIGVLVITKEKFFPGYWAVLPTVGAVLIISAGMQAWLNRVVLSSRVLVWFGLISFPLYLWHWPLLSFARIIENEKPSQGIRATAVLISIALAWLTYKLIEKPIRFGQYSREKTITLFVLMVIVGCAGYAGYNQNGFNDFSFRPKFNLVMNEEAIAKERARYWTGEMEISFETKNPKIIIFGDSQAFDIFTALKNDNRIGLKLFQTQLECSAFFSPDFELERNKTMCQQSFDSLLNSKQLAEASTLIYSHYWAKGAENTENYKLAVRQIKEKNPNIKIFFFGPKPLLGKVWISINAIMKNKESKMEINEFLNNIKWIREEDTQYAKNMAEEAGASFINVNDIFCQKNCPFFRYNKFSNFDQNHWTEVGAKIFYENLSKTKDYESILKN